MLILCVDDGYLYVLLFSTLAYNCLVTALLSTFKETNPKWGDT